MDSVILIWKNDFEDDPVENCLDPKNKNNFGIKSLCRIKCNQSIEDVFLKKYFT